MIKVILTSIQVLIGIYWCGAAARQNPSIDEMIRLVEEGYNHFNRKIKDSSISDLFINLKLDYGRLAKILIGSIMISTLFLKGHALTPLYFLFIFSFLSWLSIKWTTEHTMMLKQFAPIVIITLALPLVISFLSLFEPTFSIFTKPEFYQIAKILGFDSFISMHPILQGGIISIVILFYFVIAYLVLWLLVTPLAFVSVMAVAFTVWLARFVDKIAPQQNFFGFTIIVLVIVSIWLSQI
jgi:hypothetical protein